MLPLAAAAVSALPPAPVAAAEPHQVVGDVALSRNLRDRDEPTGSCRLDLPRPSAAAAALGRSHSCYLRLADVGHCPHSMARVPFFQSAVGDIFVRTLHVKDAAAAK
jgi:hypothetical protein